MAGSFDQDLLIMRGTDESNAAMKAGGSWPRRPGSPGISGWPRTPQEAVAEALVAWPAAAPADPAAWLMTTARRRAIDAIRRRAALRDRHAVLATDPELGRHPEDVDPDRIDDDVLNRAVAVAMASGPEPALAIVDELAAADRLAPAPHRARGTAGPPRPSPGARAELELAARLCANERERSVLLRKAAGLG
ncbi:sigma factor [Amycolatopsis tolypomycina]|uniref:sigma factor n=1 Tax=Amycolatopsis tolypomycina TaxID=208445 RepID=UPI000A3F0C4C|nr:sigma factor [Amycolatopsis tolypomycina]